jgi:hypothetical protein
MALTINQQPQAYTPVFNPQIFHATSTNSGSANHTYTFVFTDVLSGLTGTVQVTKDPVFSAGVFDEWKKLKTSLNTLSQFIQADGSARWVH